MELVGANGESNRVESCCLVYKFSVSNRATHSTSTEPRMAQGRSVLFYLKLNIEKKRKKKEKKLQRHGPHIQCTQTARHQRSYYYTQL